MPTGMLSAKFPIDPSDAKRKHVGGNRNERNCCVLKICLFCACGLFCVFVLCLYGCQICHGELVRVTSIFLNDTMDIIYLCHWFSPYQSSRATLGITPQRTHDCWGESNARDNFLYCTSFFFVKEDTVCCFSFCDSFSFVFSCLCLSM